MHIKVNIKKSSGKRNEIIQREFACPADIKTVKELLVAMVTVMVADYKNCQKQEENLLSILTNQEIEEKSASGKIGFDLIYGNKNPKLEKSVQAALQCFEDGMVALFVDGEQKERLEEEVCLREGSELTFVKLIPLAGRMW